jgi:plastocyanin
MKWFRVSVVPALAALAAVFGFLPTTGADVKVRIVSGSTPTRFVPSDIKADPGDRVAFINETERTHIASCSNCPEGARWDTGDIQPGQTVFVTFDTEGSFQIQDAYAPAEQPSTITVGNPPPAASPSPSPQVSPSS